MNMTTSGTTCDRQTDRPGTFDMDMEGGSIEGRYRVTADYGCTEIVERVNIGKEATNTLDWDRQGGFSDVCGSTTEVGDRVAADSSCTEDRDEQKYFSHSLVAGECKRRSLEAKYGLELEADIRTPFFEGGSTHFEGQIFWGVNICWR